MTVYPAALVTRDADGFGWLVPAEQHGRARQQNGSPLASHARATSSSEPVLAGEVLPRMNSFAGNLIETARNPAIAAYLRNSGTVERVPGTMVDGYA